MSDIGQKLIRKVRDIAAARPEYVYDDTEDACLYMLDGQPSCIIGHALFQLGYLPDHQVVTESKSASAAARMLGIELDPAEKHWLDWVQNAQDGIAARSLFPHENIVTRLSWGISVQYADARMVEDLPRLDAIKASLKVGSL